jgi:hypothetical protein
MFKSVSHFLVGISILLPLAVSPAVAQPFEAVGERALGMGGAFVAVANDSTATWWNPAGLASGPFLDLALGGGAASADTDPRAFSSGAWWFSLGTPPLGVSYYRFKITDIQGIPPTEPAGADREDRAAGEGIRSLSINQIGATVLHTITTGVTAGATVKYVRGTVRARPFGTADAGRTISDLLDAGDDLDGGDSDATVDIDLGVLATRGAMRLGLTARNLREPRLAGRELSRLVRAGAAFDGDAAGGVPLTLSVDADLRRYEAAAGDRRVIALGGEYWLRPRSIAVRGGARFNTVGEQDRTVTAGASVAARAGLFIEGHAAVGGDPRERGWGVAARVSF